MHTGTLVWTLTSRTDHAAAIRRAVTVVVAVLTAVAAQVSVPLPFTSVPFTLQPMVVLVGGAALGSRLGLASQLLYISAGVAGLPVFAASPILPQGVARLIGPTGGYLLAFPIAAFVAGALAERGFDRRYLTSVLAMAAGLAVIFVFGVTWLSVVTPLGVSGAVSTGLVPFLPADILKVFLAAAVLPAAWRIVGSPTARTQDS
jgi:biotin transport system substrate-specific component